MDAPETYPYGEAWKSTVPRDGPACPCCERRSDKPGSAQAIAGGV